MIVLGSASIFTDIPPRESACQLRPLLVTHEPEAPVSTMPSKGKHRGQSYVVRVRHRVENGGVDKELIIPGMFHRQRRKSRRGGGRHRFARSGIARQQLIARCSPLPVCAPCSFRVRIMSTPSLTNTEIDNPRSAASNRNRRSCCCVNCTGVRAIADIMVRHRLNDNIPGLLISLRTPSRSG